MDADDASPDPVPDKRSQVVLAAAGVAASGIVVATFWAAARALDRPFSYVSREPQTAEPGAVNWYAGSLSNLTVLVLVVGAAAALVTALGVHLDGRSDEGTPVLLWGGGLLTAMAIDDLFLLHENLYDRLVPEQLISPAYGIPTLVLLLRYRAVLAQEAGVLYLLGGAALLVSVSTSELWAGHHLLEDGFKLLGYVLWSTFFLRLSIQCIRVAPADAPKAGQDARPS